MTAENRRAEAQDLWGRLSGLDITKPPEPPEWLIEGFLDVADLSVIFGPFGSGKSFVALDVTLSMATGLDVFTMYPTGEPGAVLYVASEGLRNFENRARAWAWHRAEGNPLRIAELQALIADNVRLWVAEDEHGKRQPLPLNLAKDVDRGLDLLEGLADEGVAELIVVDVIADTAEGVDENSADFGKVLRRLRGLAAPVIALHHTGKDEAKGMRGSSAAPAAADNVILVTATVEAWSADGLNPKAVAIVLEDQPHRAPGTKRREGQHFGAIGLRLGAPEGLEHDGPGNPPATILGPSIAQAFRDSGHRLKASETEALVALDSLGGKATRQEVADALGGLDRSTISRRLSNPTRLGLIEIHEGTGRTPSLYVLTTRGHRIIRGETPEPQPEPVSLSTADAEALRKLLDAYGDPETFAAWNSEHAAEVAA